MKTLFILSLIAVSTSQAYAASDAEMFCLAGVGGAALGTAGGIVKRPDLPAKYAVKFFATTSVGACALGAGIAKGAEALRDNPDEKELESDEPAESAADVHE